ncbi:MAG: SulP family inorganic anion transporter [Elsteraceae bacterium]
MASAPAHWRLLVPKLITTLRQGYGLRSFQADAIAGLTVAIVALPLAMALAIASGTTPDKGLFTAIVAGFLISALGGSRFQIGGPTGAFVVIVFTVIQQHGYDGLVLATLMAGVILVVAGLAGLGSWIKYIPEPVVVGFTSGIALIIFSSQIKDLFGLEIPTASAGVWEVWSANWAARATASAPSMAIAFGALATILLIRRFAPRLPGFLVAVVGASLAVYLLDLPTATIGSRFGGIPNSLPVPALPTITAARLAELTPSAFTIAFLAGIESLLSAVVADGMTGGRHRSNCELVAQGVANAASALFGGMPATGAIARTATNVRTGARSPVSGMLHAVFLLAFMAFLAPLAVFVPLASLAAVLVVVAWNMSEIDHVRHLLKAPAGDRLVLILTFALTVLVDLTIAIGVGVVFASLLFMHRMAEAMTIDADKSSILTEDQDDFTRPASDRSAQRADLPADVEVFKFRGPFFFGAARKLTDVLDGIGRRPRAIILRLGESPLMDASGAGALTGFLQHCEASGVAVILCEVTAQPRALLDRMGVISGQVGVRLVASYAEALALSNAPAR